LPKWVWHRTQPDGPRHRRHMDAAPPSPGAVREGAHRAATRRELPPPTRTYPSPLSKSPVGAPPEAQGPGKQPSAIPAFRAKATAPIHHAWRWPVASASASAGHGAPSARSRTHRTSFVRAPAGAGPRIARGQLAKSRWIGSMQRAST
jgi:hypothetical protein